MTQLEKELQDVSNVAIAGHIHPDVTALDHVLVSGSI